jgi:uridine phosphorylase
MSKKTIHVYHLGAGPDELGRYVFLCGDPDRVPVIADHLQEARPITRKRGLVIWSGKLGYSPVSVVSSGMGCPSTAIVLEELVTLGAHTFIRIGTCGSLQERVQVGHLVIAGAAIRDEGTTRQYVPIEFPAVADTHVVNALQDAATLHGVPHHTGIVHCKDCFYSEFPERTADPSGTAARWRVWQAAGALATEMETAAIFVLSTLRNCRAGAVLAVIGSTISQDPISAQPGDIVGQAIQVGIDAMRRLIELPRNP